MDVVRKNSLEESYDRLINIGFCLEPYQDLSDMIDPDVMIFGTTKDEKIFSLEELIEFFQSQYKQMEGIKPSLQRKRLYTQISDDHSCALIAEEITLNLVSEDISNSLYLRTSCVMQYDADRWRITHWHSSSPVETENDHWHMEEWKRENEKLQKLINQQTSDLKNKNRELEIEVALERIRAQVTSMQESSDLLDIVVTMRTEFVKLGHEAHYFWHMRWLPDTYQKAMTSGDGSRIGMVMTLPRHIHSDIKPVAEWEKSNEPTYVLAMDAEQAVDYVDKMISLGDFEQVDPNAPTLEDIRQIGGLTFIMARTTHGEIGFSLPGVVPEPPEEAIKNLVRFAGVFDLAYKRFEDLKAAERQHREAQIELALERVRARTMAMQHSDELIETSELMFDQIKNLDIELWSCGFSLWYDDDSYFMGYNPGPDGKMGEPLKIPLTEDDFFKNIREAKHRGDKFLVFESEGKSLEKTYRYMDTLPVVGETMRGFVEAGYPLPKYQVTHCGFFSNGHLMFITQEYNAEAVDIFKRFSKVFNQTYTRFLDLQKAEAQTRISEIELALERVRARTMAMQKSSELEEVIKVVFKQFTALDMNVEHTGFLLDYKENEDMHIWLADKNVVFPELKIPYFDSPHWNSFKEAKKNRKKIFANLLSFEEKNTFYEDLFKLIPKIPEELKKLYLEYPGLAISTVLLDNVGLYIENFSGIPYSQEENEILMRFGKVFQQAYTRFLDLQKAEQLAYESKVETSLERVRGMAAAMNHSDDLMQIAEAMFKEMEILNINPLRYGLGMIDGETKEAELWASDVDDGRYLDMLGTLSLTWHPMLQKVFDAWEGQHEEVIYKLKGKELSDYYQKVGPINPDIPNLEQLQDPDTDIEQYVSFFPFTTGALYAFTQGEPNEEGKSILKRFANVFEQAHIRYNDLQVAERQARLIREERDRLELALKELEATKDQLVQQEKLASLGQLTAGIAHEIKNPLNFVNNFSDLSVELVQETKDELSAISDQLSAEDQKRVDEALEILNDIEANLKKVHEHGSRADSIVKSMLEHSRGGTGKPEDTDLNSLVKEYVNLSFHGMRAGKDPINVDLQFELCDTVGKVPLIAEDFSRVIVNLSNNAFDAMKEKLSAFSDQASASYKPKLTIRTSSENGKVAVEIEDNGPGITEEMKDKILQPFFTTKKGTQGTGLGLSITNDIVKAHGGELSVTSQKGTGTTFMIKLPQID